MPTEDLANKNTSHTPAQRIPPQPDARNAAAHLPCAKSVEQPQDDIDVEEDFFDNMPV